jgi:hypothetical protein
MNVVTSERTYASYDNAMKALTKALARFELTPDDPRVRYMIAVSPKDGRFVPCVFQPQPSHMLPMVHLGLMVIG